MKNKIGAVSAQMIDAANKTIHTNGPWKIGNVPGRDAMCVYDSQANEYIATVWYSERDPKEGAANAKIIAAAPEMLATLKMAEDAMEAALFSVDAAVKAKAVTFASCDNPSVNLKYQINSVRAAIQKAEGK